MRDFQWLLSELQNIIDVHMTQNGEWWILETVCACDLAESAQISDRSHSESGLVIISPVQLDLVLAVQLHYFHTMCKKRKEKENPI